ncbi:MAG: hypothetical protein QOK88_06585 [Nitrososphaeraceae archaeon]|nr:hypothetical protein [Nitrososphaeraceae archaeon]MDW0156235.1 hypothetical protein [Nitrososphaeraceae archaeon]
MMRARMLSYRAQFIKSPDKLWGNSNRSLIKIENSRIIIPASYKRKIGKNKFARNSMIWNSRTNFDNCTYKKLK